MNKYLLTYKEVNKRFIHLLYSNLIGQNLQPWYKYSVCKAVCTPYFTLCTKFNFAFNPYTVYSLHVCMYVYFPHTSHYTMQALASVSSVSVKEAPWPSESMAGIASLLLDYHANPDAQDSAGFTPLQRAIQCQQEDIFTILLTNPV